MAPTCLICRMMLWGYLLPDLDQGITEHPGKSEVQPGVIGILVFLLLQNLFFPQCPQCGATKNIKNKYYTVYIYTITVQCYHPFVITTVTLLILK